MANEGARRVLTFASAGTWLALDAEAVAEIIPAPRVTRVPQAPRALLGLANLRGRVAPIVSVAALLGLPEPSSTGRVIVLDRDDRVGLSVDSVGAMREVGGDGAIVGQLGDEAGPNRVLDLEPLLTEAFAGLTRGTANGRSFANARPAAQDDSEVDDDAFLAFDLAGQIYALPLAQVREVTESPRSATRLPQADAVSVGVMALHDELLPLVSLRALLGLPKAEQADGAVIITALGDVAVGLIVDRPNAIVRLAEDMIGPVPSVLNRGGGEARIAALARTSSGLVSILATERIFREETVAAALREGIGRRSVEDGQQEDHAMEQFVIFRLADEQYGLPIATVEEVLSLPERWTRLPRAPDFILGVMNHRGGVLPLVDQRRRFEVVGRVADQRRVVVTRMGDMTVGFVVDSVDRILDVPDDSLAMAPDFGGHGESVFDRVSTLDADGRLVLLVDPKQLLDHAEQDLMRALATEDADAP